MSEWEQQSMKQKQKQKVRQREKSEKKRTQLLWEYEWSLHVNFRHLLAKLESERRWTNARKLIESNTTNSNHHKRRMSEKVPEIKNAWAPSSSSSSFSSFVLRTAVRVCFVLHMFGREYFHIGMIVFMSSISLERAHRCFDVQLIRARLCFSTRHFLYFHLFCYKY